MILAIEGGDAAGKKTLAARLVRDLYQRGVRVELLSFPVYESPSGRHIKEALVSRPDIPAMDLQALMTVNRYEFLHKLLPYAGDSSAVLVLDRYYASGICYGVADGLDDSWLRSIHQGLPRPDLWLYSMVTVQESFRRRPVREDAYEASAERLGLALEAYDKFFASEPQSRVVRLSGNTAEVAAKAILAVDRCFPNLECHSEQS
jgi:dTMP kinase